MVTPSPCSSELLQPWVDRSRLAWSRPVAGVPLHEAGSGSEASSSLTMLDARRWPDENLRHDCVQGGAPQRREDRLLSFPGQQFDSLQRLSGHAGHDGAGQS